MSECHVCVLIHSLTYLVSSPFIPLAVMVRSNLIEGGFNLSLLHVTWQGLLTYPEPPMSPGFFLQLLFVASLYTFTCSIDKMKQDHIQPRVSCHCWSGGDILPERAPTSYPQAICPQSHWAQCHKKGNLVHPLVPHSVDCLLTCLDLGSWIKEYRKALQRHYSSKNFSPFLSIPQTFSQLTSWPADTSKDEDPKVGIPMHDTHIFLLVTENKFSLKTGYIQNNFLIDLISGTWLSANMWVLVPCHLLLEAEQGLCHWGIPSDGHL